MTLPNFLVIGAMKAATSSLHTYLGTHPDVFVTAKKEVQFFVGGDVFGKGLSWYEEHFASAGDKKAIGESSPQYTFAPWFPGIPERIAGVIPNVRLIYLVREPVDRMRSHWVHQVRHGRPMPPLDEALIHDAVIQNCTRYGYQLRLFLDHFPREQLLVLDTARLRADRPRALAEAAQHLEVDPTAFPAEPPPEANRSDEQPTVRGAAVQRGRVLKGWGQEPVADPVQRSAVAAQVSPDVATRLRELLADDLAYLTALMGDAAPSWARTG